MWGGFWLHVRTKRYTIVNVDFLDQRVYNSACCSPAAATSNGVLCFAWSWKMDIMLFLGFVLVKWVGGRLVEVTFELFESQNVYCEKFLYSSDE